VPPRWFAKPPTADLTEPNNSEVVLLAIHLIQLMTITGRVFKKNQISGFNNSAIAVASL
jgi:hypothetical protein